MTLVNRTAYIVNNATVRIPDVANVSTEAHTQAYKRILVFLNGTPAAERAIPKALELAVTNNAELVLVCQNHAGADAYIQSKCGELNQQGFKTNGYVVSMSKPSVWLVDSEKADAVVVAQKTDWLGRLFTGDVCAKLRSHTSADVYDLNI